VLAVLVLVTLVRAYVLTAYTVPSASMTPTLRSGDRILVDRLTARWRGLQRGGSTSRCRRDDCG